MCTGDVLQTLVDKDAIREVLARTALTMDAGDAVGFASLFERDGSWTWETGGLCFAGRSELAFLADAVATHVPGAHHAMYNHVVELHGDAASAECEFVVLLPGDGQVHLTLMGRYHDHLARQARGWRIQRREVSVQNPEIVTGGAIGELYRPFLQAMQEHSQPPS